MDGNDVVYGILRPFGKIEIIRTVELARACNLTLACSATPAGFDILNDPGRFVTARAARTA
ncbi:hypothetical protein [Rubneribacter sp.]|nr:hypothetical protein [Candidatus Rubneribacter avistercoris]